LVLAETELRAAAVRLFRPDDSPCVVTEVLDTRSVRVDGVWFSNSTPIAVAFKCHPLDTGS
jgi:hypothetical protein